MATVTTVPKPTDSVQDKLQELTVEWNVDRFMAMLAAFLNNLSKLYPECALVARQTLDANALQGAPAELVTAYIREWHRAMSQEHQGATLYQLVKRKDAAAFHSGLFPLATDLALAHKWDAVTASGEPDLDTPSREYIWTYLNRLNRHARFACLAPQKMLAGIARLMDSGVDVGSEAGILAAMEQLGPHVADHVELANATQLIPDLLEQYMGEAGADMLNVMGAVLGGNSGSLEDIVGSLAAQLGEAPVSGEGANPMMAFMEQLRETDPTTTADTPSFQAMLQNFREVQGGQGAPQENPMAALMAQLGQSQDHEGSTPPDNSMAALMSLVQSAGNGSADNPMAALMAQLGAAGNGAAGNGATQGQRQSHNVD